MTGMSEVTSSWGIRVRRNVGKLPLFGLKAGVFALEVYGDLLPGVRMRGPRRLPKNMGAGLLGAEVATWWATSPSLLPRPWWVTAANVAICQAVGHAAATGLHFASSHAYELAGGPPPRRISRRAHRIVHASIAATTAVVTATSMWRQDRQAALVEAPAGQGHRAAITGILTGTLGYGAILLLAEGAQTSIDQVNRQLRRWLPPLASWPLALTGVTVLGTLLSDRVIVQQWLNRAARSARQLNEAVFPGTPQPPEKERSGSPHSQEKWGLVGSKGRELLSRGPRARDIARVTGLERTREPIRVFIGFVEGRSLDEAADLAIAELERTGAFERSALVLMTSAGTGWLSDFSVCAVEFLTGGDCALVAMQYSYLPSALSYVTDRDSPVESSTILLRRLEERLADIDPAERPRLFVSGESLGAYGVAESFDSIADLLARTDGAVFSGAPSFTTMLRELTALRDEGSPSRLPLIDGGRHVRFTAHPAHLRHDYSGTDYPEDWATPRVVIAQHASDPIAFWNRRLFFRQPEWLREPGARGEPAPAAQRLDVFDGMRWVPFITGWQVGLDQLTSLNVAGGHGHNYHLEMIYYWHAVLADLVVVPARDELFERMGNWITADRSD